MNRWSVFRSSSRHIWVGTSSHIATDFVQYLWIRPSSSVSTNVMTTYNKQTIPQYYRIKTSNLSFWIKSVSWVRSGRNKSMVETNQCNYLKKVLHSFSLKTVLFSSTFVNDENSRTEQSISMQLNPF